MNTENSCKKFKRNTWWNVLKFYSGFFPFICRYIFFNYIKKCSHASGSSYRPINKFLMGIGFQTMYHIRSRNCWDTFTKIKQALIYVLACTNISWNHYIHIHSRVCHFYIALVKEASLACFSKYLKWILLILCLSVYINCLSSLLYSVAKKKIELPPHRSTLANS